MRVAISSFMKNNAEHRQLPFWNLRLLLALTTLLFSHQLFAQSCAYTAAELADAIGPLQAVPEVDGEGLVPGAYAKYYFVSGPPICSYQVSGDVLMDYSAYCMCDDCDCEADESEIVLFRINDDGNWGIAESITIQGLNEDGYTDEYFDWTVKGGDVIGVIYWASGTVYDYDLPYGDQLGSGIGFSDLEVTENTPGTAASIKVCPTELPTDDLWTFGLGLSETDTFFDPEFEFYGTRLTGWTIATNGVLTPSSDAAAGSLYVKCYEGLSVPCDTFSPQGDCINFPPDGTSGDYIEKTITAVATPEIQYTGLPYASANSSSHHDLDLSLTATGADVFGDAVTWSIDPNLTTAYGCTIDATTGVVTLGEDAGELWVKASSSTACGYYVEAYVTINPAPTISVDRDLAPYREGIASVSEPGAFADITWSIVSNDGSGAAGCSIVTNEGYGIITAGSGTGTITIQATDTDGYYVQQEVTVYPTPTFTLAGIIEGPNGLPPACLALGLAPGLNFVQPVLLQSSVDIFKDLEFFVVTNSPAGCVSGYFNADDSIITLSAEAVGTVIIAAEDLYDDYYVEEEFPVRPAASVAVFNNLDALTTNLAAWGYSPCWAEAGGEYDEIAWTNSAPFAIGVSGVAYPGNAPQPPASGITITPIAGTENADVEVTSPDVWSVLPYSVTVTVYDPECPEFYSASATLEVRPESFPPPGPFPQVALSPTNSTLSGGSVKCYASLVDPEQMNLPVSWSVSPALGCVITQTSLTTATITPGTNAGQVTVIAADSLVAGYYASSTLTIDTPALSFNKTVLVADGTNSTTATLTDAQVFPTVTWSLGSTSPAGVRLATNGTSCVVTASTTTGTVTLIATSTSGSYAGDSVSNTIGVHAIPTISFGMPYLDSGNTAQATVSDTEVFPPSATTWSIVSAPTGVVINPTNGIITDPTGTAAGTITVQAQSSAPDNYVITGSLGTQQQPVISFSPPSLSANSPITALASIPPGIWTSVSWAIVGANPTGTRISPSSGVITAGTQPGVATVRASDQYANSVTNNFTITAASMVFGVNPLLADGRSKCWATVRPVTAFAIPTWSIQGETLGCTISDNGEITAGKSAGTIVVTAVDPASGDYAQGTLTLKSDCLTSCNSGNCVGGGGEANNNSVDIVISLGYADFGQTEVTLTAETNVPCAALTTPSLLQVNGSNSPDVQVIGNPIQQVKSPTMLAVIQVVNASSYTVSLYDNSMVVTNHSLGSPYVLNSGSTPFCVWTIANPTPGNYNLVNVTETRGSASYVANYTYSTDLGAVGNGWDMLVDGGTRLERRTRTSNPVYNTETYSIMDAATQTVRYQEVRNFQVFAWGEELVGLTVGTGPNPLTTTWIYDTNSADSNPAANTGNYQQVSEVLLPNGSWEAYQYDAQERKVLVVSQFLDNPAPASITPAVESANRVTTTTYNDTNNISEQIVTLQGVQISHQYTITSNSVNGSDDVVILVQCQNPGVTSITAAGNLFTTNCTFPAGSSNQYLPHLTTRPDGTIVLYAYSYAPIAPIGLGAYGPETKTVQQGQPNANYTAVVDGTKTVTVLDDAGNVVSQQQFDIISSSLPLSSKIATSQDIFGRPETYTYGDNSSESISYSCCGMGSLTDRSGVESTYDYDNMKRLSLVTTAGVSILSQYNSIGKLESVTRITLDGTGSDNIVTQSYQYDTAGRLSQSTDLIGTTTIGVSTDGNGHEVVTTTYPNQSTLIETYFLDGSRLSIGGTAVYPSTFQYGADATGYYKTQIKPGQTTNSEWVKASVDMLNRQYMVTYPPGINPAPTNRYYYSQTTGQLVRQTDPDGVATLYAYNNRGELYQKAIDMDQNGLISTTIDRVQQFSTTFQPNSSGTAMLVVKHTFIWDQPGDGYPTGSNETFTATFAIDGSYTNIASMGPAGPSSTWTVSYNPAAQTRTQTETLPDNTQRVNVYVNGRLASTTALDSNGHTLLGTSYQYFTNGPQYGFLQSATDNRNGTTSYTYNAADEIASITTPSPGFGQTNPLVTQYTYDDLNPTGRIVTTILPDQRVVTQQYALTGEIALTVGGDNIPVQYQYQQGRVTNITTWRTYGNNSTAETTTFTYTPTRGFLQSKSYAGAPGPTNTYYDSGRTNSRTWGNGQTTTYVYNNAGDLAHVNYSGMPSVTYTYNTRDQIQQVTDQSGVLSRQYGLNGLLSAEVHTNGILNGLTVQYSYDAMARRKSLTVLQNGVQIVNQNYTYNGNDSLLQNFTFNGLSVNYGYEPQSTLVNGVVLTSGSANTVTNTRSHNYLNQLVQTTTAGSGATLSYSNQFSAASKLRTVTMQDGSYWIYAYGPHGELQSANRFWSDGSPVAGQQFDYSFDDAGNRITSQTGGGSSPGLMRTTQYTPNAQNQYGSRTVPGYVNILGSANSAATVTANNVRALRKTNYFSVELPVTNTSGSVIGSATVLGVLFNSNTLHDIVATNTKSFTVPPANQVFQYDGDGNLQGDGISTYTWDGENRLSSVTTPGAAEQNVSFVYDYRGRRVSKTASGTGGNYTRTFLYDGWNLIAEFDSAGGVRTYAYGPNDQGALNYNGATAPVLINDQMSPVGRGCPGTYYVAVDMEGNVAGLFNATSGTQSANYEYGPFGEPLRVTGVACPEGPAGTTCAEACPFRFGGKYHDDETGLIYYGKRYFSTSMGRWLNHDPIEENGGPNLYGFVGNDPINQQDLLGLIFFDQSSSYWQIVLGRFIDPRAYYENFISGDSGVVESAYAYNVIMAPVQLGRALLSPLQTANALLSIPGMINSGQLKCLLGDQYDQFLNASPDEQLNILGGIIGTAAGGFATGATITAGAGQLLELAQTAALGGDADAFAYYMQQAQALDVSTAENEAVFYSGQGNRELAEQFAIANERTTLEMTSGGQWLDEEQLFGPNSPLTPDQARQVWAALSQRFAAGASGNAVGFVNGASSSGIFNTIEYPALLENPNIVNVITGGY